MENGEPKEQSHWANEAQGEGGSTTLRQKYFAAQEANEREVFNAAAANNEFVYGSKLQTQESPAQPKPDGAL